MHIIGTITYEKAELQYSPLDNSLPLSTTFPAQSYLQWLNTPFSLAQRWKSRKAGHLGRRGMQYKPAPLVIFPPSLPQAVFGSFSHGSHSRSVGSTEIQSVAARH